MIALYVDGRVDLDARPAAIEAAVRTLDGAGHSLLVVELPTGMTITVGGGPERFVVELSEDVGHRWNVLDPRRPEGTVTLSVSGERVDAPARFCVERAAAVEAVRAFVAENGARSDRLQWVAETPPRV